MKEYTSTLDDPTQPNPTKKLRYAHLTPQTKHCAVASRYRGIDVEEKKNALGARDLDSTKEQEREV